MAHTKAQKAAKGNKDSWSKRLGIKLFGGEVAKNGNIIVRQRGFKFKPGLGVGVGKDQTIFAITDGEVVFKNKRGDKTVNVFPKSI